MSFPGTMMSKKQTDSIDGPPFLVGILTVLKQFNVSQRDVFIQLMAQYVKSLTMDGTTK